MNNVLVQLDQVSFSYGDRTVLQHCDLSLRAGQRIGLAGANGSGKTTLLSLIVGLRRPTAGRVLVLGSPRCTEADFREVRGPVGLMFQLFCPTVAEDIAFGPFNLGKSRTEVEEIVQRTLSLLGMEAYADRVTYRLSGGEKRLVALGTVLAMDPQVLLLDEPVSGLDEVATRRVAGILASLPQAMLVVSHNRDFLDQIITDRVRLADGRVVEHDA
jgi:cobalt/nickel transport system ATP-binding protein